MEKARKGLKPVKLPKELFVSWRKIVGDFIQSDKDVKVIPAVIALKKLINCEDATYERQASCIKEAGNNDNFLEGSIRSMLTRTNFC